MIQSLHLLSRLLLSVLLAVPVLPAMAAVVPLPLLVAESDDFEVVGRLQAEGLVLHVDRAASNEPVLAASLEIDASGRTAKAVFRPASGDYLVADAGWLEPLRQAGEHALALTLIAGEESDLLSGELVVAAPPPASAAAVGQLGPALLAVILLTAVVIIGRRLRRVPGGAA